MKSRLDYASYLLLIGSVFVLYIPTLYTLFNGVWASDEQMHGPLVFAISLWLIYRNWGKMTDQSNEGSYWGWLWIFVALVTYFVGRTYDIIMFELGSIIPFLLGIGLVNFGTKAMKTQWFALFFMLFMVPLPSSFVDLLTMPMKLFVSYSVENILFWLDYPVARSGVIIQLGQYKLLVANACAGLHTLLTLEAMGLLYLNLVQRNSFTRNLTLALLIIPISLIANVIRVLVLCLITYYYGDEAGQSYLHDLAGMVLFMSALILIISFDSFIHFLQKRSNASKVMTK